MRELLEIGVRRGIKNLKSLVYLQNFSRNTLDNNLLIILLIINKFVFFVTHGRTWLKEAQTSKTSFY